MKHAPTESLEPALGYRFQRPELLQRALTHSSHARENLDGGADNEQFEFLGDAVLGFVTSQELFTRFPTYAEGELSKLKAHLVSSRYLLGVASRLRLGEFLRLGRGEEKTGGRSKSTLLSDALEAVIAAVYLDGGVEPARAFILERIVLPELARLEQVEDELLLADYKSRLQEMLHASGRPEPEYVLLREEGPEHRKQFIVEVRVRGRDGSVEFASQGAGASKKRAGQVAAQLAVHRLGTDHKPDGGAGDDKG
ncbi:MAG TPA: ribonuclease III [Clostridia bacterium]|nr:ribonuclease III [Clostridia bacterium]